MSRGQLRAADIPHPAVTDAASRLARADAVVIGAPVQKVWSDAVAQRARVA